ncbi:MAG: hypothetical protein NVS2B12_36320 [Ktedonobacteraceae bacterium]
MNKRHHHQVSAPLAPPKASISIGELARLTGFNARAIRYYEQIGVLPHSSRADNGYRSFCQADVNRLHLLRRLRLLGISLLEAKSLLVATLDASYCNRKTIQPWACGYLWQVEGVLGYNME